MGGDTQLNNILQCFYAANTSSQPSGDSASKSTDGAQRGSLAGQATQVFCGVGQRIDVKTNPQNALEQLYKAFEQAETPRMGRDAAQVRELARDVFKSPEQVTVENVASFKERLNDIVTERHSRNQATAERLLANKADSPIAKLSPESAKEMHGYMQARLEGVVLQNTLSPDEEALVQQFFEGKQYYREAIATLEAKRSNLDPSRPDYTDNLQEIGKELHKLWTDSSKYSSTIMSHLQKAGATQSSPARSSRSRSMNLMVGSEQRIPSSPLRRQTSARPTLERSDKLSRADSMANLKSLVDLLKAPADSSDSESDDEDVTRPPLSRQPLRRSESARPAPRKEETDSPHIPVQEAKVQEPKTPEQPVITRTESAPTLSRTVSFSEKMDSIEGDSSILRTEYQPTEAEDITEVVDELIENLKLIHEDGKYDFVTRVTGLTNLSEAISMFDAEDLGQANVQKIKDILAAPVFANLQTQEFATARAGNVYKQSLRSFSPAFKAACTRVDDLQQELTEVRNIADRMAKGIRKRREQSMLPVKKWTPALNAQVKAEEALAGKLNVAQQELATAKLNASPRELAIRSDYEQSLKQKDLLDTLTEIKDALQEAIT